MAESLVLTVFLDLQARAGCSLLDNPDCAKLYNDNHDELGVWVDIQRGVRQGCVL